MNKIRWFFLAAILWGIPTFFLFLGIGNHFFQTKQEDIRQAEDKTLERLEELLDAVVYENFVEWELGELFQKIVTSGRPREEIFRQIKFFRQRFPKDCFEVGILDGSNHLIYSPDDWNKKGFEKLYKVLKSPWEKECDFVREFPPEVFPQFSFPASAAAEIRESPGKFRYYHGLREAIYWNHTESSYGIIVLVRVKFLTMQARLENTFLRLPNSSCFGFSLEGGKLFLPQGLSMDQVRPMLIRSGRELEERLELPGKLAVIKTQGPDVTVFAIIPIPITSVFLFFLLVGILSIVSFFLLLKSFRAAIYAVPWEIAIGWKFIGFFSIGLGFPVMLSLHFGNLLLDEKRQEVLEEYRQMAFAKLNDIDEGCGEYFHRLYETYDRLIRQSAHEDVSQKDFIGKFQKLHARYFFDWANLVDSSGKLVWRINGYDCNERELLSSPISQRKERFFELLEKGNIPVYGFFARLFQWKDKGPARNEFFFLENYIDKIAVMAFDQYYKERGVANPKKKSVSDMVVQDFMESVGKEFDRLVKNQRVGLHVTEGEVGEHILLMKVVENKRKQAEFFLALKHRMITPGWNFLKRVFRSQALKKWPFSLKVIGIGQADGLSFPSWNEYSKLKRVARALWNSKKKVLFSRQTINGQDFEIAALAGRNLRNASLFALIPRKTLEKQVGVFKQKMMLVLLGTVIFGLCLASWFYERLLLPVGDLTKGVKAIQAKDFSFRLPIRSQDELGQLSDAFNRTIVHLGEMEVAAVLQKDILPPNEIRNQYFKISGKNQMTQAIGGDYFDLLRLPNDGVAFLLGDVSGHGVSAALVTAMAKGAFTILCPRLFEHPEEILRIMGGILHILLKKEKMMTCLIGVIWNDPDKMILANCGQNSPLVLSESGELEYLAVDSVPLGILKNARPVSKEFSPAPQFVLIYSDGLVESMDEKGIPVGYEKFVEICSGLAKNPETASLDRLFEEVRQVTGTVPWDDDATAIIFQKTRSEK